MALATDTTNFVNILAAVFFLDSRSSNDFIAEKERKKEKKGKKERKKEKRKGRKKE